jgi:hypothetical protein
MSPSKGYFEKEKNFTKTKDTALTIDSDLPQIRCRLQINK